jgi:hypothetical protein
MTERLCTVPAMRSPRASNCSVMMRPKPLLTPVMSQFLWAFVGSPFDCKAGGQKRSPTSSSLQLDVDPRSGAEHALSGRVLRVVNAPLHRTSGGTHLRAIMLVAATSTLVRPAH